MPYTFHIDPSRRVAVVVSAGDNDLASSLAAMDQLAAEPAFEAGFGILCDFRENTYTPGTHDARVLADAYNSKFTRRPMALVVTGLLHYGVANMITTVLRLSDNPVAAFRELAEAERWLEDAVRGLHSTG